MWLNGGDVDPTDDQSSSEHHVEEDVETLREWGVDVILAWYYRNDTKYGYVIARTKLEELKI